MTAYEINFDGLVGPTHHHAGLARGAESSKIPLRGSFSNPRKAARQILAKMKWLSDLGVKQAIFPPHERPCTGTLRAFGFSGTDAQVLRSASTQAPDLLAACSTASCMMAANAATISPSSDTADHRVHVTPANLAAAFHRSVETPQNVRTLRAIFRDKTRFSLHDPLPAGGLVYDEGAANHVRLAPDHALRGLHLFVHAQLSLEQPPSPPLKGGSHQAYEASRAVARVQRIPDAGICMAQLHPDAIEAGATHADNLCIGNENVFLYHERAFVDAPSVINELKRRYARLHSTNDLVLIEIPSGRISLEAAIESHMFNSQLVTVAPGHMAWIAPVDAEGVPGVHAFLQELITSDTTPIQQVRYFDLRDAIGHNGGPASLRLRAVLNEDELAVLPPGIFLDETLYVRLNAWIRKNYRDKVTLSDLADPLLLEESRRALDELTQILGLGSIYRFQMA